MFWYLVAIPGMCQGSMNSPSPAPALPTVFSWPSTAFPSWVYPSCLCSCMNQSEELDPAEPSKEGGGSLFAFCPHWFPALFPRIGSAQGRNQHGRRKGVRAWSQIRRVLWEGLQLLPLKSCWPTAYKSALLVLVVGLLPGKRPIASSRDVLETVIKQCLRF